METSALVLLAVKGLLAASLPLAMVWMSSDANKYRKLVWVIVFLTFDLIVFGAFTRLTDSGLGCPDWPGCYGAANPFIAHEQIAAAEALMPTGPVTVVKAWIEMTHRYLAMGIGFLIMALMATSFIQWRKTKLSVFSPLMPTLLFLMVCVQGAFGAWTVTLKLQPVIVTIHLLLGMGLLALLVWMGGRQDHALRPLPAAGASAAALAARRPLKLAQFLESAVQRVPDLTGQRRPHDPPVLARPFDARGDRGRVVVIEEQIALDVALHWVAVFLRKPRRSARRLQKRIPLAAVAVPRRRHQRDARAHGQKPRHRLSPLHVAGDPEEVVRGPAQHPVIPPAPRYP